MQSNGMTCCKTAFVVQEHSVTNSGLRRAGRASRRSWTLGWTLRDESGLRGVEPPDACPEEAVPAKLPCWK